MHEQIICTTFLGLFVAALPRLLELADPAGGRVLPLIVGALASVGAGLLGYATGWYGFAQGPGVLVSLAAALVFAQVCRSLQAFFGHGAPPAVAHRNRADERAT